jgi:hypothetical protein
VRRVYRIGVNTQRLIIAGAIVASIADPVQGSAADQQTLLEPRQPGQHVTYRLDALRRGTKETVEIHTSLAIASRADGVWITSSAPADAVAGTRAANGAIVVTGNLQAVVEPYNEIQTAVAGMNARNESEMTVWLGSTSVRVPVVATVASAETGNTTMTFAGSTDTPLRGFKAHVVVNLRAVFSGDRLLSATATNEVTAHIIFKSIRIEQTWSLARVS